MRKYVTAPLTVPLVLCPCPSGQVPLHPPWGPCFHPRLEAGGWGELVEGRRGDGGGERVGAVSVHGAHLSVGAWCHLVASTPWPWPPPLPRPLPRVPQQLGGLGVLPRVPPTLICPRKGVAAARLAALPSIFQQPQQLLEGPGAAPCSRVGAWGCSIHACVDPNDSVGPGGCTPGHDWGCLHRQMRDKA